MQILITSTVTGCTKDKEQYWVYYRLFQYYDLKKLLGSFVPIIYTYLSCRNVGYNFKWVQWWYSGGKQHLQQWKTSISPSNVALNTNPGTVLKSACPEDSKTPPTYNSINLLNFFRIISFVFDLKYLSQNSINSNMLGVFWNPQD